MTAAEGHSDFELLELVRRGDPAGAEGLFGRYSQSLLRFATRMLRDAADGEEAVQDVFLKLLSRADQYDGRAAVSTWLFSIAANACRDRLRRLQRRPVVPLDDAPPATDDGPPADHRMIDLERRDRVRRALMALSTEQREALVLARYHGLPYAEIARILEISEGAVKTRIFRAMVTLKDLFSQGDSSCSAAMS